MALSQLRLPNAAHAVNRGMPAYHPCNRDTVSVRPLAPDLDHPFALDGLHEQQAELALQSLRPTRGNATDAASESTANYGADCAACAANWANNWRMGRSKSLTRPPSADIALRGPDWCIMQFSLRNLFFAFLPIACLSWCAGSLVRHWDLKSYYIGFYGVRSVPSWATGTGGDSISEALGAFMAFIWMCGPWPAVAIFGIAAAIYGAQAKGGLR